ncbi:MAG: preprotein translocase subunit SecG [Candidatus Omnitrophica bacterium]|nr:preprotein translocase subunit SecG [Candidatus Omnitrophota bacterium]
MIYIAVITVHIIASLILILVILLQAGRGGGLSETFGMSSTQSFFGTSATKFLQRSTEVAAIVFLCTCLGLTVLSTKRSRSLMEDTRLRKSIEDIVKEDQKAPQQQQVPQQDTAKPVTETQPAPVSK